MLDVVAVPLPYTIDSSIPFGICKGVRDFVPKVSRFKRLEILKWCFPIPAPSPVQMGYGLFSLTMP
jgi:hypothetical protein